jgi:Tol biopolymer transport system component
MKTAALIALCAASRLRAQPVLFAPGVISTPDNERSTAFTPDGDTVYFVKRSPEPYYSVICVSARVHGQWTAPRVASFSGRYNDTDPAISANGRDFVFTSTRSGSPHLWTMRRSPTGDWTAPEALPSPINSESAELTPSFGPDGSLYFSSNRTGGAGSFDLYVARHDANGWVAPVPLSELNTAGPEFSPAVSKDGMLLVFMSVGRSDELVGAGVTYNRGDLYVSHRIGDAWGPAMHLPSPINSAAAECCPNFSPDGETMYFTSERGFATETAARPITWDAMRAGLRSITNGLGNIYATPTRGLP